MAYLIEDLRFCIGAFFVIVGGLLTAQGLMDGTPVEGVNLNLWTGVLFLVFGGGAVAWSLKGATFGAAKAARSGGLKPSAHSKPDPETANGSGGKSRSAGTKKPVAKKKKR